jgi:hypothetical protein
MDFSFRQGKDRSSIRRSGKGFDDAGAEKASTPIRQVALE